MNQAIIQQYASILLFFFLTNFLSAQPPTVGLIENTDGVSDGYILFTSLSSEFTYLIDNCGRKINEWGGLQFDNSNIAFMAEDGTLVRATFNSFQKLSWNNEVLWSFDVASLDLLRHHDFLILPNGNILFIASKSYPAEVIIEKGRNPSSTGGNFGFKVDGLYEIRPIGINEAEVVWSWSFFDHLVQDFNEEAENFDVISNQPRRIDVNFNGEEGHGFDWLHCNGIDYNPTLDQIIISSRSTCEYYIIDHSTTTEEAASSEGGTYGFGGDFLWRWGNPVAYGKGTSEDQKLWEQHDPKWVKNGYPNGGMISSYNNRYNFDFGNDPAYSSVHLINPQATNGVYPIDSNGVFLPNDFQYSYTGQVVGNNFWSGIMSSAQVMENGNFFVCQGKTGEMFEVNSADEIVWIYQNPVREFIYGQGSDPLALSNAVDIFITTKYPSDFVGFDGYDMTPSTILENENIVSDSCNTIVGIEDISLNAFSVYPNPVTDVLTIESLSANYEVSVVDVYGREVLRKTSAFDEQLELTNFLPGIYFLILDNQIQKIVVK